MKNRSSHLTQWECGEEPAGNKDATHLELVKCGSDPRFDGKKWTIWIILNLLFFFFTSPYVHCISLVEGKKTN